MEEEDDEPGGGDDGRGGIVVVERRIRRVRGGRAAIAQPGPGESGADPRKEHGVGLGRGGGGRGHRQAGGVRRARERVVDDRREVGDRERRFRPPASSFRIHCVGR